MGVNIMMQYSEKTEMKLEKEKIRVNLFLATASLIFSCGTGSILGTTLPKNEIKKEINSAKYISMNTDDNREFLDEFNKLLQKNNNLKSYIDKYNIPYEELIIKYGNYLDKKALLSTISDLNIEVDKKLSQESTLGEYSFSENKIYIKESVFKSKKMDISKVFTHEFYHYLLLERFGYEKNDYSNITESFTELLSNEALNCPNSWVAYKYGMLYSRALAEFLSKKACIYLARGDSSYAVDELSKYVSKDDAIKLLRGINDDIENNYYWNKGKTAEKDILENEKNIINTINYIDTKKNGDKSKAYIWFDEIVNYDDNRTKISRKIFLNLNSRYLIYDKNDNLVAWMSTSGIYTDANGDPIDADDIKFGTVDNHGNKLDYDDINDSVKKK